MNSVRDSLRALRQSLAALDPFPPGPAGKGRFALGHAGMDEALGGGLARAGLHEVFAAAAGDAGSAAGFAAALALGAAGRERTFAWVRQRFAETEAGALHAPGLAELGFDPGRLLLVRAPGAAAALRAGEEAARCPALGAVLVEIWGNPATLDLTATRRLALAGGKSGVTVFLLRLGATPQPGATLTRWRVGAGPSRPLDHDDFGSPRSKTMNVIDFKSGERDAGGKAVPAFPYPALATNAPGHPAFTVTLLRQRAGPAGRQWRVEWDRDQHIFRDVAPLSRPVVSVPAGRPAAAEPGGLARAG